VLKVFGTMFGQVITMSMGGVIGLLMWKTSPPCMVFHKRGCLMSAMKLTPSRKSRLIVMKVLEYAETGGMEAEDCGIAFEAIDNCLMAIGDDPEVAMSGLIEQIRTIANAEEVSL
jgi:hypothetical protein